MDGDKERELERQARVEASLREREREVQKARSEQTKEIDREREQHKREEAIQAFRALMSDMVSTHTHTHIYIYILFCWPYLCVFSLRQEGGSALPKDTMSFSTAGNRTNNLLINSPTVCTHTHTQGQGQMAERLGNQAIN